MESVIVETEMFGDLREMNVLKENRMNLSQNLFHVLLVTDAIGRYFSSPWNSQPGIQHCQFCILISLKFGVSIQNKQFFGMPLDLFYKRKS